MKKTRLVAPIFTLALGLTLALAACSGDGAAGASAANEASASQENAQANTGAEADAGGEEGAEVGIANPWSDVASAEEAAAGAGIDAFEVADSYTVGDLAFTINRFSCMQDLAEADYDGGASELVVRKGRGMAEDEVHGDYNDYGSTWSDAAREVTVTCRGFEPEIANLITWTSDDYVYAIMVHGLGGENFGVPAEEVAGLVSQIQ